jgi:glycosyltransferase involved in cell wall biosynthesis
VSTLFNQTDRIFTLSTQGTQALEAIKASRDKSVQLFHPIYEHHENVEDKKTLRNNWGIPENAFVLLFFGLIREYKGLSLLIEAFNSIAEERNDIHLVVAGEFYESQLEYEEQIQPEFQHRVHIHNHFLSSQEVAEILSLSDVLVLPYKHATQSGVLADAIAYNLPAIATKQPGFTDFLTDEVNGLIMKERTVDELINKIKSLNSQKLDQLKGGMTNLRQLFSWERFAKELFINLPN